MSWVPVLEDAAAARALAVVRHLAKEIKPGDFDPRATGLAFGPAGLALLLSYLAKADGDGDVGAALGARARGVLVRALAPRDVEDDPGASGSFFSGFPGLTWAVEHLGILGEEGAALCRQADEAIAGALGEPAWPGTIHHADGLVGLGAYLLERPGSDVVESSLARVVLHLERAAVADGAGSGWLRPAGSFPEPVRPPGDVFDLGVPRGTPGVVGFLAAALGRGVTPERTEPLLRRALDWLLRQRVGGSFGDYVVPGSPPPGPTRLAWCYGDLGVSHVLLAAARALEDRPLEQTALDLALRSTERDASACEIEDAGFCHGAAGAGHLYARLHHATGEPRLATAARRWFEAALELHAPGEGSGGFSTYYPTDDDAAFHRHADPGLLMGASGIGLALLSACQPVTPAWDRCFLLRAAGSEEERG